MPDIDRRIRWAWYLTFACFMLMIALAIIAATTPAG